MPAVNDAWLDAHRVDPAVLMDGPLIGIGHVEGEIASLAARLADPERAARLGADIPRSVLLHGPAGIGKTHSARALARRLGGLAVYEVGADELTAPMVRDLFAALDRRHDRSILVVDEVDLAGAQRSESDPATRRTLAALLTALDGLRPAGGVFVVAATSQSTWDLDPALLRAGRLGYTIELQEPDEPTRARLLEHFLSGRPLAADVDVAALAAITSGDTPADLRAACADAAGIALARGGDAIAQHDLRQAVERAGHVLPAQAEPALLDLHELRRVCVHEAGHVVVGSVLLGPDSLAAVKVGPTSGAVDFRGPAGSGDDDERSARDRIALLMGGFGAERVLLGGSTLAHGNDIRTAGRIARDLVARGLVAGVAPVDFDDVWVDGTTTRDRLADAAAVLLADARERAAALLGAHRDTLNRVALRLEEQAKPLLEADPRRRPVAIDLPALRAELERQVDRDGAPMRGDDQAVPEPAAAAGNGRLH